MRYVAIMRIGIFIIIAAFFMVGGCELDVDDGGDGDESDDEHALAQQLATGGDNQCSQLFGGFHVTFETEATDCPEAVPGFPYDLPAEEVRVMGSHIIVNGVEADCPMVNNVGVPTWPPGTCAQVLDTVCLEQGFDVYGARVLFPVAPGTFLGPRGGFEGNYHMEVEGAEHVCTGDYTIRLRRL